MREAATQRVRQAIVEVFPTASVQVFGSFVTGMPVTYASCCAAHLSSRLFTLCYARALACLAGVELSNQQEQADP